MNIILFDNANRRGLLPLVFTRAVAELRAGIFTTRERWQLLSAQKVFIQTEPYLQSLYEEVPAGKNLCIDASVLPDAALAQKILNLEEGEAIASGEDFIAGILPGSVIAKGTSNLLGLFNHVMRVDNVRRLQYPWQIFQWNDGMLREDFEMIRALRAATALPAGNTYINSGNVFIEEGAQVSAAIINASAGPVYIARNAVVMEGALIRGPLAVCEGAVLKMGVKIYGATTIGPYCMAGGEIKNSVMLGYSNKAHDGYLGDSVIGYWCNLGAGTSNSNVKNTGSEVKMWSYADGTFKGVGVKGGVIMGDYSRTAINTSINTGTVAGVCCNMFDGGLLPKYIPSFSWGGKNDGKYNPAKALDDIANWKKMKGHDLSNVERQALLHVFENMA